MDEENKRAVDEVIANLKRIPTEIKTDIIIKDILREVDSHLQQELRRRTSYK